MHDQTLFTVNIDAMPHLIIIKLWLGLYGWIFFVGVCPSDPLCVCSLTLGLVGAKRPKGGTSQGAEANVHGHFDK